MRVTEFGTVRANKLEQPAKTLGGRDNNEFDKVTEVRRQPWKHDSPNWSSFVVFGSVTDWK